MAYIYQVNRTVKSYSTIAKQKKKSVILNSVLSLTETHSEQDRSNFISRPGYFIGDVWK